MSILKWVGGKRQLLERLSEHLPPEVNNYYEPFGGSLTMTMYILEKYPNIQSIHVSDVNTRLINLYTQLKNKLKKFIDVLDILLQMNEEYTTLRERFNTSSNLLEQAVLMFILNKRCFNGLYRVNKSGLFNVPEGKNNVDWNNQKENLKKFSKFLKDPRVHIYNMNYQDFFKKFSPVEGDLVYIDPPYWDTFVSYDGSGFSEDDQKNLCTLSNSFGCHVVASNSNNDFIKNLYGSAFQIHEVSVRRSVNSDSSNRKGTELIMVKK